LHPKDHTPLNCQAQVWAGVTEEDQQMDNEGDVLPREASPDEKGQESATHATKAPSTSPVANQRVEVSAQTIARMMGIASATDLQVIEGRLDLLASRVSTLMTKVDKVLAGLGALASISDIGRLETQIASMKSMLRDAVESVRGLHDVPKASEREGSEAQSRKLREGIQSSSD
jgi:hypothetical protein